MVIKFSEEQRLYAVQLYQEGKTVSEVKQLTNISFSYIKNLLKKYKVKVRPSGFQKGNPSRKGKSHSSNSKIKISEKHKLSGHKPSLEAVAKGQPLTLKVRWGKHIKDPVAQFIRIYKQGATKRKLDYLLTREEFEFFINKNCYYCGVQPSLRKINGCDLICNGIDRLDNSIGYIKDNCTSACKVCNVMKSTMNYQNFIQHCRQIGTRFVDAD